MRIQILPLPSVVVGEVVEEPFALIVDQWRSPLSPDEFMAGWYKFRDECGAKAVFVTEDTVEVVDRYAEPAQAVTALNFEMLKADVKENVEKLNTLFKQIREDEQLWASAPDGQKDAADVAPEPAEIAGLPPEVRTLVHAVDRMRDQWAEADVHVRYELWMAVHDASDAVYRGPYQESPPPAPPHFDAAQRLQKAGEAARAALGIYGYGSMDVAAAVPHAYNDSAGEAPYCVACGLGRLARVHELRCSNCGKRLSEPACGPGHAMAAREIAEQESATARWPRLQRDRSEGDD